MQQRGMTEHISVKDGSSIPVLGAGTWFMGEHATRRATEIDALRAGIEQGLTLLDTAEMYGDGQSEKLIGEAITPFDRSTLYLVSKVYPHNAGRSNIFQSCEQSLKRLRTDYLDLYLLHWRGRIPLAETVDCMEQLVRQGKIRRWGVSNLDTADMQELLRVPNGEHCVANQVLYHLGSRGIEYDLLPMMQQAGIAIMAYCPLAQNGSLRRGILQNTAVGQVARAHGVSPQQVLLAFVLHAQGVMAIPKSGQRAHMLENMQAVQLELTAEDCALLDAAFPPPTRKISLDIV